VFAGTGLATIPIPDSVTSIGTFAFAGTALTTVYISPEKAADLGNQFDPPSPAISNFYSAPTLAFSNVFP